jgi:hypothetical protein
MVVSNHHKLVPWSLSQSVGISKIIAEPLTWPT